jgi:hypothetical protein
MCLFCCARRKEKERKTNVAMMANSDVAETAQAEQLRQ